MKSKHPEQDGVSRRRFLGASTLAAGSAAAFSQSAPAVLAATDQPAILGGKPVKSTAFPGWPVSDATEENAVVGVVRSGKWGRSGGSRLAKFEQTFAQLMNARHCLATSSGTAALLTALNAMGVGPGDEVIVPPYTFVASINVILARHALPVFVDTDPETFQLDARKLEALITDRTVAILAVHLGGSTFDVDAVQAAARKHNVPILEDSCQSHLAEWRGRRTGTFGAAGCFSFQASKNLNSGEGGAILASTGDFIERCYAYHNNGRSRVQAGADFTYQQCGLNLRMTEFQAGILAAQMTRLEAQSDRRRENGNYLTSLLREIPGLTPARMYEGCTRNAYHLYMFRYDPARFAGLSRDGFVKALAAEGVPASGGYAPLNSQDFLKQTLAQRGFQRVFSKDRLTRWEESNRCPANDRLCGEAVWFTQNMLIGPRSDMDEIAEAARKIQRHSGRLAKV